MEVSNVRLYIEMPSNLVPQIIVLQADRCGKQTAIQHLELIIDLMGRRCFERDVD